MPLLVRVADRPDVEGEDTQINFSLLFSLFNLITLCVLYIVISAQISGAILVSVMGVSEERVLIS